MGTIKTYNCSLCRLCSDDLESVFGFSAHFDFLWSKDNFSHILSAENAINTGIFINKTLTGFLLANGVPPAATIELFAVHPDYQGQGLGRQLFDCFTENAKNLHIKEIDLEVSEKNPAVTYYKKLGFLTYNRRSKYYPNGEDALLMKYQLYPTIFTP